jgi:hypothetical protein
MRWNVPTLLTWLRMLAIPLLVLAYMPVVDAAPAMRNLVATSIFVAAASPTGSTAGWRAGWARPRRSAPSSTPVADKLLVCAALVLLLDLQRVGVLVAVIIVGERSPSRRCANGWPAWARAPASPCIRSAS